MVAKHGVKQIRVSRWTSGQSVYVKAEPVGSKVNAYYREHVVTGKTGPVGPRDPTLEEKPFTPRDETLVARAERALVKRFHQIPAILVKGKPLASAA